MMAWLNLQSFFEKYFKSDDFIIIACSTWPDSMFLLYEALKTSYKDKIVACYFNHKLREEADIEEKFLEDLWEKMWFKVEIWYRYINEIKAKRPSISLEELAREKRYDFLAVIKDIYKAPYILTAHHIDDKIETFLFNICRWTKLSGAINMRKYSQNILRPLIDIEKKDILKYLQDNKLEYKIDNSNFDTNITRNKLRLDIIPQLENINKNYKKNIYNFSEYLRDLKDFIDEEVNIFLSKNKEFKITDFNNKSLFLQKEIMRYIYYKSNWNSNIWLSSANIDEMIKFINSPNWNTKKEINNLKLYKKNNIINF